MTFEISTVVLKKKKTALEISMAILRMSESDMEFFMDILCPVRQREKFKMRRSNKNQVLRFISSKTREMLSKCITVFAKYCNPDSFFCFILCLRSFNKEVRIWQKYD